MHTKSIELHNEALEHIVGGVNSPSRSYKAVGGGSPVAMEKANGAYFWDVDGNKYIDYLAAYGPIITGHAHPHITEAIKKQQRTVYCMEHRQNMRLHLQRCSKKPFLLWTK